MKLNEICEVYSGYALKAFNDAEDGLPVIKIGNILTDGTLNLEECQYTTDSVNEKYYSQRGDIYIALSGATTGKIGIMDAGEKYVINQRVGIVRQKSDDVPQEYIKYFLLRQTNRILQEAAGCAQPNISPKQIAEYVIPDTSQEKMQEICEVLDRIKKIIDSRKAEMSALDDLIKARFVEMFGDVQHEEKYKGIQLGELCTTMSGGTPSTKFPEYYEGDIPWISTVSLGPNYIDGTTAKGYITQEAVDNSATKLIPAGNILFGTRVGVGKSSLNNVDICTNQDIVAIVGIDESKFNRLFIKHVLDAYQSYYDSIKKGATILGITGDDLKDTLIPNAPIEIQIEFEKFVNQVDKSKVAVQKALDETQLLFNSLMQKYFG